MIIVISLIILAWIILVINFNFDVDYLFNLLYNIVIRNVELEE